MLGDFATDHRGVFVTVFVLPISLLFDLWFRVRAAMVVYLFSAPKLHVKRVEEVQRQVVRECPAMIGADRGMTHSACITRAATSAAW